MSLSKAQEKVLCDFCASMKMDFTTFASSRILEEIRFMNNERYCLHYIRTARDYKPSSRCVEMNFCDSVTNMCSRIIGLEPSHLASYLATLAIHSVKKVMEGELNDDKADVIHDFACCYSRLSYCLARGLEPVYYDDLGAEKYGFLTTQYRNLFIRRKSNVYAFFAGVADCGPRSQPSTLAGLKNFLIVQFYFF